MKITTKIGGFVHRRSRDHLQWEIAIPITREVTYDTDHAHTHNITGSEWYDFIIDDPEYDMIELESGSWFVP